MGSRFGRAPFRTRRGRGTQARPMASEPRRGAGPGARSWLGWAAAAVGVVVVAFLVGRAGSDARLPTPTPLPSAPPPLVISFGTALDPATGEATNLTDRFRATDRIAYSVRGTKAPGVDTILVEIVRVDADGPTVVQRPSTQHVVPTSKVIAFQFTVPVSDLLAAWGDGDYAMRIYIPGSADPFATGQFTLVETPTAS
jgi:hypothetical protein